MGKKIEGLSSFLNGDTLLLVISLLFSIFLISATTFMENEATKAVPRLFGALGIIFSVAALILNVFSLLSGAQFQRKKEENKYAPLNSVEVEGSMNLYVAIILILIYIPLVQMVGFVVGSVIEIMFFLWFANFRRLSYGFLYAFLLSSGIYVLFKYFLKIKFPRGFLNLI